MRPAGFRSRLLEWYERNARPLPWRSTSDPYRIWLSEVMLQQTRARAAIPYYQRFLERFPDLEALARAPEADVLAAWSGLGYYSRARNLHRAAQAIAAAGAFPSSYEEIRALPGVGDYTAAAVASIAFGLPHAVVDGNVLRVVARVADDPGDIASPATRARFAALADGWLDRKRPGAFNQAMMELGATLCLPRAPLCCECPVSGECLARARGTAAQLPMKLRKARPELVETTLVVVERCGRVLLWQRPADSPRLAGFWELPAPDQLPGLMQAALCGVFRHTIVNRRYTITVRRGSIGSAPAGMCWFRRGETAEIPLSTAARKALIVASL